MTVARALDTVEAQLANQPTALVAGYRGQLDRPTLDAAFAWLTQTNPILRTRLGHRDDRPCFDVIDEHPLRAMVGPNEPVAMLGRAATGWSPAKGLSRLVVCIGRYGGRVAMFTDHSIADGRAKFALFHDLWAAYTAIAGGRPAGPAVVRAMPAPPTTVLAERLGRAAPTASAPVAVASGQGKVELTKRYVTLTARETAGLSVYAREHGLTVNGLLTGAVLASQRRLATESERSVEMTCVSRIDLRSRLSPGVGALETTNLSGVHEARTAVASPADPVEIGREVARQLRDSVARRFPENDFLDRSFAERERSGAAGPTFAAVSNLGRLPELPAPPELQLEDFSIYSHSGAMAHPAYAIYTYRDRLSIQFLYRPDLYADRDMNELLDDVVRFLQALQPASSRGPADHPMPAAMDQGGTP